MDRLAINQPDPSTQWAVVTSSPNTPRPGARERIDALISSRQTRIFFQPIVDIVSHGIFGYEALARPAAESGFHGIGELLKIAIATDRQVELELHLRELSIVRFAELGLDGQLFLNASPATLGHPNYAQRQLHACLRHHGLDHGRVVLELTEQQHIEHPENLRRNIEMHRREGVTLALDDFASGYNGLLHWMDRQPDLIKIDREMIVDIDQMPTKYRFVRTVVHLAKETGTRVVAEGVERQTEARILAELGVDYLQGYLLGRPLLEPIRRVDGDVLKSLHPGARCSSAEQCHIRNLIQPSPSVQHSEKIDVVMQRFLDNPEIRALPVLDGSAPVGIAWRHDLMNLYASPFGRPLNERRAISRVMDRTPIIVEEDESLSLLSRRITDREHRSFHDVFIITRGRNYVGIGHLIDLLRALTDTQLRQARYLNPLSQLPGNVPIDETLDSLLAMGEAFALVYVDLDHFKAINDHYGFKRGDNVLLMLTDVLKRHIHPAVDFLGHVGGDDFVAMFRTGNWAETCRQIIHDFNQRIVEFYDEVDRDKGHILCEDRDGNLREYPVCSVTLAALAVPAHAGATSSLVTEWVSEIKSDAKRLSGSNLLIREFESANADL